MDKSKARLEAALNNMVVDNFLIKFYCTLFLNYETFTTLILNTFCY